MKTEEREQIRRERQRRLADSYRREWPGLDDFVAWMAAGLALANPAMEASRCVEIAQTTADYS